MAKAIEWVYDIGKHKYINAKTGRALTDKQVTAIRDGFVKAREAYVRGITNMYTSGEISLPTWTTLFEQATAETMTALHTLGAGGAENAALTGDALKLQELLDAQLPYSRQFISEVEAGKLTDDQIAARAAQYQSAGIEAYEQAQANDWGIGEDMPYYPADGGTECGPGCRCSWVIEDEFDGDDQVTYITWETNADDKVCADCAARAAENQRKEISRTTRTDRNPSEIREQGLRPEQAYSEPTPPQDVRCPVCGRLQMRALRGATGIVERKCDKCNEMLTIDLSAQNLAFAGIS